MSKNKRYIAVFMLKEQNAYTIRRKKKLNPEKNTVSYSGKTFIIDISKYTFSEGLTYFYCIDLNKCQKSLENKKVKDIKPTIEILTDVPQNPELIDDVVSKNLVGQITSNFNKKISKKIFDIITGALICSPLTFVIGFFIGVG